MTLRSQLIPVCHNITLVCHLTTSRSNCTIQGMKPFKAMTIRLSADQAEELNTIAAVDGQPVSQVIRLAIAEHIEERKRDGGFQDGLRQRIERAQRLLASDQRM